MIMRPKLLHSLKSAQRICSLAAMLAALACADRVVAKASMDEVGIRLIAAKAPKPVYPQTAVDERITGVVVASLVINPDGRVDTVVVLEAPDPSLAAAVQDAVNQWKFQLYYKDITVGRLTFYFRIVNGRGRVLESKEMPGSLWPEPPDSSGAKGQKTTKDAIFQPVPDASIAFIDKEELDRQLASTHPVILDIRERDGFRQGHLEGAVNIPFAELGVRAPIELSPDRPIVIDCSQEETWCRSAGNIVLNLQSRGFSRLSVYR